MPNPFSQHFGPRTSRVVSSRSRGGGGRLIDNDGNLVPVGGSGGSSAPNIDLDSVLTQLTESTDAANAANQTRSDEVMSTVDQLAASLFGEGGTFTRAEELLAGTGESARQRIADSMSQALADSEQSLIDRGLTNTTIRNTERRGIRSDAERAHLNLDDMLATRLASLLTTRAGAEADQGRFRVDSLLSRVDESPELGMFMALIERMFANSGGN